MGQFAESQPEPFVDRRQQPDTTGSASFERRQFSSSHGDLTPPARELAIAIDKYKLENRRRFITYEEIMAIVKSLGYAKQETAVTS